MKTLHALYEEHHGKLSDKWSIYLDAFEDALREWRNAPVRMLEIGVQNGGSLEIWPQYFPAGERFIGCDVDPNCAQLRYDDPRVEVIVGNANVDGTQAEILARSSQFEIIIDDGSHTSGDIVRSFARYFPHVVDGGIYVIEDLHCGYWLRTGGGLHDPTSSISFLKLLVDIVNHEHWGIPAARKQLICGVLRHYGIDMPDEVLAHVHSVSFANSICFIRKEAPQRNSLGYRVFAGEEDVVQPGLKDRVGVKPIPAHEEDNPWSSDVTPPAEQLQRLQQEVARMRVEAAAERAEVERLANQQAERADRAERHAQTAEQRAESAEHRAESAEHRAQSAERRAESSERRAGELGTHLHAVLNSTSWRMVSRLHPLLNRIKAMRGTRATATGHPQLVPSAAGTGDRPVMAGPPTYASWLDHEAERASAEAAIAQKAIAQMKSTPLISVLMPVYNAPDALLRKAIASVQDQLYPHWELCIADDGSTQPHVRATLDELAAADSRIRIVHRPVNGHISEASNSALEIATGDYVALLDHDDELHPFALYRVAVEAIERPYVDLFYTDEDKIDEEGRRSDPYFKSDFNYELLLSHNMICHLGVYRRSVLQEIGGFRKGFEGAQDYDLALRVFERIGAARIRHIPRVLYHWRMHAASTAADAGAKPYATTAARNAVSQHLARRNTPAEVLAADEIPDMHRVRYMLPGIEPSVDIIIPTRDRADLLEVVLGTVFDKTAYGNFRVVVVDNGSVEPRTHEVLKRWEAGGRVDVLRVDAPFNFSLLNNMAVARSQADFVCLLNNDIEVTNGEWLREMVSHAVQPGVGCVGARLWYPNGTLQHGGVVLGVGGVAGHAHKHIARGNLGYFGRAVLQQSYSAVTAACLVVRRSIFEKVGGFDEKLQVAFNDVDFCLRVREAGYRNVWTPYAELVHHESISRGYEDTPAKKERFHQEALYMKERWRDWLHADPAYSQHLTLEHEDFSLRAGEPRDLW